MSHRSLSSQTLWFLVLLVLWLPLTATAKLPTVVDGQDLPSLAPMLERATPAVVNIATRGRVVERSPLLDDPIFRRFFGVPDQPRERQTQGLGSGVIVDAAKGYVLTNNHVIDKAEEIVVTLNDGRSLPAKVVGADPATDLAVLAIEAKGLTAVPLGDSGRLRVGDFVVAIGNPFGLGQTVTSGIVSALGRSGLGIEAYEDFIQTDASINPGNSGGALVNLRGELVGINSAIISRTGGNVGIGFAVPTEIASSIMRQILDFGEVRRGLLGVSIADVNAEVAEALSSSVTSGALITRVEPGSAAEDAGLEVDDIIVGVNEKKIAGAAELRNTIGLMRSGDEVEIEYYRDNDKRSTSTALGQQRAMASVGAEIHPGLVGAQFAEASVARDDGVEVTAVEPGSPAAQRGLRAGDIITAINRRPVRSLAELNEIASSSRILFLLVQRGDRALMLQIR